MLNIQPTNEHPIPDNDAEQIASSLQDNVRVASNTANLMFELGMPFEMTAEDDKKARKLFEQMDKKKGGNTKAADVNPPELYQGNVALKLSALLSEYDHRVIVDATQARTYLMNRLLEISACGDVKSELRAIELLGKMSDISAFSEKSEVTITHRTSGDIRQVLQEKITRLLDASVVDVKVRDVRQELGLIEDVEVTEIKPVEELDELGEYIASKNQKAQEAAKNEPK